MKIANHAPLDLTRMRITLLIGLFIPFLSLAQDTTSIVVTGRVSTNDPARQFYDLMIVNKRTHSGSFGNPDGSFSVVAAPDDTLMFGAVGLSTRTVGLAEYAGSDTVRLNIKLRPLAFALRAVEVLPERTLKEIEKDIAELGYNERDYRLYGVDALQSPITFLYQAFSKRERSRRKVAELINEERKRDLLKELLHLYVEYDIINLSDEAFDEFIDFVNVPDSTIQGLSQYDFLVYIKRKYDLYSRLGPTRRH